MPSTIHIRGQSTAAQPAVGRHAEALADLTNECNRLLNLIERERNGTYDGLGPFWLNEDSVLVAARKLARMAEQRIAFVAR